MRLHWPDCLNTRDLGGLPAAGRARVRARALVRSDCLGRLTDAGVTALRDFGVKRIVDLRSVEEVLDEPGPFAADPMYHNLPFIDEVADRARDPEAERSIIDIYRGSVARNGATIAAALAAVADAPPGGVLVHCYAGKDRTGVLVALLLRAVGVPDEEIAADYELTAECLRERHAALLAEEPDEQIRASMLEMYSSRAETMLDLMAFLDERYGGTRPYLDAIGLTPHQIAALRDRLLE